MKRIIAILFLVTFPMAGCGLFTASDTMVTNIGEDVNSMTGKISDSATIKQGMLEKSRQVRDKAILEAYKTSGLNLEFEMVSIGGTQAYLPKKISFKERPDFGRAVADSPADHPFWASSKSWVHDIVTGAVIFKGLDTLGGIVKNGFAASGSTYNGPTIIKDSQNTVSGNYTNGDYSGPLNIGDQATTVPETVDPETVTP